MINIKHYRIRDGFIKDRTINTFYQLLTNKTGQLKAAPQTLAGGAFSGASCSPTPSFAVFLFPRKAKNKAKKAAKTPQSNGLRGFCGTNNDNDKL